MVAESPTQDMPPPGGYAKIAYKRIPARSYFRGWHLFAGCLAIKCAAFYAYYNSFLKIEYENFENRSSRFALQPLLTAERDRGLLRQLRINRDEEEKLMANVPNWEVGKYYKDPIFKTVPSDTWLNPLATDFFAHSPPEDMNDRVDFKDYHF